MTSGYIHIDMKFILINLSIRIKLCHFVRYNHVVFCKRSRYFILFLIFKKTQKNVRNIWNALFGLGLRIRVWRERSHGNITTRTVNTPTGGQMSQTMAATKTAPYSQRHRYLINGTTTDAQNWWCLFVKWIQTCNFVLLKRYKHISLHDYGKLLKRLDGRSNFLGYCNLI